MGQLQQRTKVSHVLALLTDAEKRLAECTEYDDVLKIQGEMERIRYQVKKQRLGLKLQNHAAKIKIQAERKIGEALAALNLPGGDRKSKSQRATLIGLKEMGLTKSKSSRWQLEARVSKEQFTAYCDKMDKAGEEVSSRGLRRFVLTIVGPSGRGRCRRNRHEKTSKTPIARDGRPSWASEAISEAREHLNSVVRMFEAICTRLSAELETVELREIPRYLTGTLSLLDELDHHIQATTGLSAEVMDRENQKCTLRL